jgi:signal transduction histidine kinase
MPLDLARATRLLESGLALSSELALDILLQRTVELAADLTDARYAALGVVQDGQLLDFLTTGLTPDERRAIGELPRGNGVLGELIERARTLRLHEIAQHPSSVGFPPNHPPMRTFLGTPIRARGVLYGNLYLTEKRGGGDFTAEDEEAIVLLASQAGVAIANASLYRQTRLRERWLEVVRDMGYLIVSTTDTHKVLQLLARHTRELTGAAVAMVLMPAKDGDDLEIVVADGSHAAAVAGMRVPMEGSMSGRVLREGKAQHLSSPATAAGTYAPMIEAAGMGPSIFIPVSATDEVFGVLAVSRGPQTADFQDADVLLLESFAAQVALAFEYGRAQRDLRRLELAEDRERIAKELHDGVIQSLFAVGLGLQGAASLSDGPAGVRIEEAVTEIDGVISDLRRYIFGLRPDVLSQGGLAVALEQLCADSERRTGVTTVLDVDVGVEASLATREADVVQFVREALSNVSRHAQATTCRVSVRRDGTTAVLEVDDDGLGFDPLSALEGMGMSNMRDRAERLGGEVVVDTVAGEGTTVRVLLPLG